MGFLGDLISSTITGVVKIPGEIATGVVKGVEDGVEAVSDQLEDLVDP